jgi:hypothetical protein
VTYHAVVRDAAGHEKDFCFKHQIEASRLARAVGDRAEATKILQEVTMPHHDEMLKVRITSDSGSDAKHTARVR